MDQNETMEENSYRTPNLTCSIALLAEFQRPHAEPEYLCWN